ncbi:MAG: GvpL/GvpF family gas vesicle protein [Frankia sp.]|nr:GvpL/GvpF family gas vesicle protein [Frankia sp.]
MTSAAASPTPSPGPQPARPSSLGPPETAARAPDSFGSPAAQPDEPALFLHCVVRAEHQLPSPPPLGVGEPAQPVRLLRAGPVAAVASPVTGLAVVGEQEAQRHLDLLVELLDGGPLLPLRLGSVAPDEEAVREEVLTPAAEELLARLDALDGLVEVHVDVDEDAMTAVRAAVDDDPRLAAAVSAGGPGPDDIDARVALGERVAEAVVARRERQADALLARLRPAALADAGRGRMGGPEDPVLRWAFLVRRDDEPEQHDLRHFDQAVEQVRREHPELVIEYVGPLPAFHFTTGYEPAGAGGAAETSRWGW